MTVSTIAMVGQDVASTKSPEIFNAWFEAQGRPERMVRAEVSPAELSGFIASFRTDPSLRGIVLTAPHKAAVVGYLDASRPEVKAWGLANAVRKTADGRLDGGMFDGDAFVGALSAVGLSVEKRTIGVVGCGAAGLACAWTALSAAATRVSLLDRVPGKAAALAQRLVHDFPLADVGEHEGSACDIWVNATPLGSSPEDPSPLDADRLGGAQAVLDLAAGHRGSELLRHAQAQGLAAIDGRAFAQAQFEPIRRFLFGDDGE